MGDDGTDPASSAYRPGARKPFRYQNAAEYQARAITVTGAPTGEREGPARPAAVAHHDDVEQGHGVAVPLKKLHRYSGVCTRPYQSRAAVTARSSSCHSSPRSCRVRC